MASNQIYTLPKSLIITPTILKEYVQLFWSETYLPLHSSNSNMHLMVICKVKYSDPQMGYKSIAHLRKITVSDQEAFANYLIARLGQLTESYHDSAVEVIIFSHLFKVGKPDSQRLLVTEPEYKVNTHTFNNMVLPLTFKVEEYGNIISKEVTQDYTKFIIESFDKATIYMIEERLDGLFPRGILPPDEAACRNAHCQWI